VGINSAIRTGGGMGSNGVGFAIPSTTFSKVMDSLIANGKVERGWLGVSTQALTPDLATSFSAETPKGALVSEVMADTPAAKAGLESGDIITEVNGRAVASSRELVNAIGGLSPGEKVKLKLVRDGDAKTLSIVLGTRPGRGELASAASESEPGSALGMSLQPMTEELAKQLGAKVRAGALVSEVEDGSPAAEAGLTAGDVIVQAGGKPVATPEDVAQAARKADAKGLLLKVRHENSTRFVVIKKNG
jgi:serine protease Do